MWSEPEINLLIRERRERNEEFHGMTGRSKVAFWTRIAGVVNIRFNKTYTGEQCREKFQNLVRDHKVRKLQNVADRN
jgi:hypothetical protein